MPPLAWAALAAILTSTAATFAAVKSGPVAPPTDRGLHATPTPSGGGIAIILGTGFGAALVAMDGRLTGGPGLAAALACAVIMGLVGAADDLFDLGARLKLVIQAVLAIGFSALFAHVEQLSVPHAALSLGPVLGVLGSALWIIVAVNAVNFVDGANGLSPGAMVIAFAALALACRLGGATGIGEVALVAAAAGLGFLPWNLPGGRIFQGDSGALFSGTLFAGLALLAAGKGGDDHVSVWFGPTVLLPFLTDVFLTLISRARRRQPLLQAHRDHLFQRWLVSSGASHGRLSVLMWLMIAAGAALGLAMGLTPVPARVWLFAGWLGVCLHGWWWIDSSVRERAGG